MPISLGQIDLELKLLPLSLSDDGSASVTVRKGYVKNSVFVVISTEAFAIPSSDVSLILDAPAQDGLSRRDDLSLAIYSYLVGKGLVEAGAVS